MADTKLPPLPPFPTERATLDYKVCTVCGQRFDTRDVDQVFHHDSKPHEPIRPNT